MMMIWGRPRALQEAEDCAVAEHLPLEVVIATLSPAYSFGPVDAGGGGSSTLDDSLRRELVAEGVQPPEEPANRAVEHGPLEAHEVRNLDDLDGDTIPRDELP